MATWNHLRAVLLPATGAAVIPGFILWLTGPDTLGLWQSAPAACVGLAVLGGVLAGEASAAATCPGHPRLVVGEPALLRRLGAGADMGLLAACLHTCHHRTQVQSWLRLAGHEPVPAIYGPASDMKWDEADPTYSVEAAKRGG